ncbi:hypothetical protein L3X39_06280 [Sabulilitoribacter multivorans]|uniref:Lipocalin-like domain-containing protein n=1 Tax=Flaviramulus multivorans TaxID=1304750 RepID=A0ABS9II76_9FLAO|nr:hypothetical protein [Flaviramulus multivorans]MCF7560241.1 hypothetical protein [Flaviramulus multivorans]
MKTIVIKTVLILFITVCSSSCISSKNYANRVKTWEGHDVNNLITSWGPPADVYTMPNGNKMYTWLYTNDGYITKRYNEYLNQIEERKETYYCKTTFTANANNTIINWRFQGNACVAFK